MMNIYIEPERGKEDEIANFIIDKIIEKKKEKKSLFGFAVEFGTLVEEIKKDTMEKFKVEEIDVNSSLGKLGREQLIYGVARPTLTAVGEEIISKYHSYLNYKNHILKEQSGTMMPVEYCLDKILFTLESNWENQKDGFIEPLNATDLLYDFKLPGRHEFLKGLIRKLENDGYVEFKDISSGDVNNNTSLDTYRKNTLITVKGYYFIKNERGYTEINRKSKEVLNNQEMLYKEQKAQQARQEEMSISMEKIQRWNLFLTTILAIGTTIAALYYGIEIWKSLFK
jgi:hypothetical protein